MIKGLMQILELISIVLKYLAYTCEYQVQCYLREYRTIVCTNRVFCCQSFNFKARITCNNLFGDYLPAVK